MRWHWQVSGTEVELDYNVWSGRKRLVAGGRELAAGGGFNLSWEQEVDIADQSAVVRTRLRWLLLPEAHLEVAGIDVEPTTAPRDVPAWAWLFALVSLAVLVVARGGAIPGAFAGVGAVGAVYAARMESSLSVRLALAAASTGFAWGGFYAFVYLLTM